jgi:preprotein translocase subunit SecD
MPSNLKWKTVLIAVLAVLAIYLCLPSLMWDYGKNESRMPDWWKQSKVLFKRSVVLGLDLQGGMHLVVSVNTDEAVKNDLVQMKDSIRENMKQEKIATTEVVLGDDNKLSITYPDGDMATKGDDFMKKYYVRTLIPENNPSALKRLYTLDAAMAAEYRNNAVKQVMETLNSRIDEFGVAEPSIQKQGLNRIVLQLPGIKEEDRNRVLTIIQRTAKLEFMLVDNVSSSKDSLLAGSGGNVPPGKRLVPEIDDKTGATTAWYLLKEEPKVSGTYLVDARMSQGGKTGLGGYNVDFQFNLEGARVFARLTGENINQRLAIVLEDKVKSAPVIRARIFDRGVIEGNFKLEEARDLAIVLRAGALPVSIKVEEERTVGPTLGKDLIARGQMAAFISIGAVLLFMVLYYSVGGLVADFAVLLNVLFIFAGLATLRATLTLPGIAGIALTVGMAVDANVIIFERMREELRAGRTPQGAIDAGYQRSLWTILDSNITTLIAAGILFQVGTGAIRGFATTLSIGLISSVFTSVVVTRAVYDLWFYYRKSSAEILRIGLKTNI